MYCRLNSYYKYCIIHKSSTNRHQLHNIIKMQATTVNNETAIATDTATLDTPTTHTAETATLADNTTTVTPATTTNVERTLATKYFMQTTTDFETGRSMLYQLGVKTSYNNDAVIFSNLRACKNNANSIYIRECNGLILRRSDYKPIVVPQRTLRLNINTEASNVYLHQGLYHIYKAMDGTCFNMYFNETTASWTISTSKGLTMNDVKWDDKTYQEIITECLAGYDLTWESFTSKLDVTRCYSFGFKHPTIHKFFGVSGKPSYVIWFIQSVDTNVASEKYLWASDQSPIEAIQPQERYMSPVSSLRELYKKCNTTLEEYFSSGDACHGFILRSVNPHITGEHSDLFIESTLQRTIRRFWYDNNIINTCHKNAWDKTRAITLSAFLNVENRNLFIRLFPQYAELFKTYTVQINSIIDYMVELTINPKLTKNITNPEQETALKFIKEFGSHILYDTARQNKEQLKSIFTGYICHVDSLNLLM